MSKFNNAIMDKADNLSSLMNEINRDNDKLHEKWLSIRDKEKTKSYLDYVDDIKIMKTKEYVEHLIGLAERELKSIKYAQQMNKLGVDIE